MLDLRKWRHVKNNNSKRFRQVLLSSRNNPLKANKKFLRRVPKFGLLMDRPTTPPLVTLPKMIILKEITVLVV